MHISKGEEEELCLAANAGLFEAPEGSADVHAVVAVPGGLYRHRHHDIMISSMLQRFIILIIIITIIIVFVITLVNNIIILIIINSSNIAVRTKRASQHVSLLWRL